jgi:hypothetical protein
MKKLKEIYKKLFPKKHTCVFTENNTINGVDFKKCQHCDTFDPVRDPLLIRMDRILEQWKLAMDSFSKLRTLDDNYGSIEYMNAKKEWEIETNKLKTLMNS